MATFTHIWTGSCLKVEKLFLPNPSCDVRIRIRAVRKTRQILTHQPTVWPVCLKYTIFLFSHAQRDSNNDNLMILVYQFKKDENFYDLLILFAYRNKVIRIQTIGVLK